MKLHDTSTVKQPLKADLFQISTGLPDIDAEVLQVNMDGDFLNTGDAGNIALLLRLTEEDPFGDKLRVTFAPNSVFSVQLFELGGDRKLAEKTFKVTARSFGTQSFDINTSEAVLLELWMDVIRVESVVL